MPHPPDIASAKRALRERFQRVRTALEEDEYREASEAICERLAAIPQISDASTVSIYWPLLVRREVDTRPLIDRLLADGKRVVLPVVAGFESAPEMGHVAYAGEENLETNRWGLREPAGEPVPASEIDAVVVPALGAGRNLHRVGYGRGYYDAFLRDRAIPAFSPVFAACLVDEVPGEAHDVRLHGVVTERETVLDTS